LIERVIRAALEAGADEFFVVVGHQGEQLSHFLAGLAESLARYCQVNSPKLLESAHEYLQTPPISTRHHQLRSLALLSIQS